MLAKRFRAPCGGRPHAVLRSSLLVAVAALSMVAAGAPPASVSAAPLGAAALPESLAPQPADPEPALPGLTEASPLDEGRALPPSEEVPSAPEQGAARLGASAVALAPLTFTFRVSPYAIYTAPRDQYPYRRLHPTPLVDSGVHDASGVPDATGSAPGSTTTRSARPDTASTTWRATSSTATCAS